MTGRRLPASGLRAESTSRKHNTRSKDQSIHRIRLELGISVLMLNILRPRLTDMPKMFIKPIRNQNNVGLPSRVGVSDAFPYDQTSGYFRGIQAIVERSRLLDRHRSVLIAVDQDRRWIVRGDVIYR